MRREGFFSTPAMLGGFGIAGEGILLTIFGTNTGGAGVLCLDARNVVRFGIAGDGTLIDDLGTNRGARVVELCNGRAVITLKGNGGKSQASVSSRDIPSAFLQIA